MQYWFNFILMQLQAVMNLLPFCQELIQVWYLWFNAMNVVSIQPLCVAANV